MKRALALILAILSTTAQAGRVEDILIKYAIGDASITKYTPIVGDPWLIWHGGPIKPGRCGYVEYAKVADCIQAITGTSRLLELTKKFPKCFIEDALLIPVHVRVECALLNPLHVASYFTGSRPVYDIAPVLAWASGGQIGTMPKKKIGNIATQVACGPRAAFIPLDGDFSTWWEVTNAEGVYGMAYCK